MIDLPPLPIDHGQPVPPLVGICVRDLRQVVAKSHQFMQAHILGAQLGDLRLELAAAALVAFRQTCHCLVLWCVAPTVDLLSTVGAFFCDPATSAGA